MKKYLNMMMAGVLAVLLLTGCANTADLPEEPVTPPTEEQPSILPAPADPAPQAPDVSVTPEVPDAPVTPEVPDAPMTPEVPDAPVTPEVPDAPVTPEVPDAPVTPEMPDEPVTPEVPDAPVTPETPETPPEPPVETDPPAEPDDGRLTCTITIRCDTVLDNMALLDPDKTDLIPGDGLLFEAAQVEFFEGESVFHVLQRTMKQNKRHLEFVDTPMYNSVFIEGICNLYAFDCGDLSGWMYRVNGEFPTYGCSHYALQDGDRIEWVYTCDLGADIGGENASGNNG